MASLTSVSVSARKVIRYGVYAVILILILRFAFNVSLNLYRRFFPPRQPEPTLAFGKLPKLALPDRPTPQNIAYTLELPEGNLPTLIEQAVVYTMPPFQSDIEVVDNAKKTAQSLGFRPDGKVIVESIPNVYIFEKSGGLSNLTMNVITGVFSISYNINQNPSVVRDTASTPEAAIEFVRSFLEGAKLLQSDLSDGPATHGFLKYEAGKFVPAISQSEANAIKVNLFRKGYGAKNQDIPSVTPDMPESNVWFIVAGRSRQIIAAEYHYFPIDKDKIATYPLKTSEAAFEELKQGKAFITNLPSITGGSVIIRKVYLSYYDAGQYAEYYQPVIVFEGDNNFYGFVPAVIDEHYGKEQTVNQQ
ncbi:hypothetical protein A2715_00170 [Candidatus Woesebacteria bacterium RIFCSPHIGHO2_01_FULL_39_32]|uniref:Regulatory protein YycH domain-containing protein n=2 Tax=Candidatus Woeseibacteriota TaxID=1752722 RepID=A0A1F8BMI6_9BACT|nr:MAG: hypothetical protein A2715_00170 [Candidatus Woesebacteria bacterium RIFCSPHIGHO2_01_FULL_39_32]OGM35367.1 MAG: hypothetical protein A3F01_04525 [Candidatus Woesebacteria bacterium RIFCSPHIGHO2_12_FULL_38_11]OGM65311.1 MAG: hypothetical protein A2893_01125 [Candidatus Woesebacteria bacterium RIFCSPLOWO2_01_FULL_39_25]